MTLAEQIQIVEDNLKEYGVCDITIEEFNYLKDELYSSGCLAGMELGRKDAIAEISREMRVLYGNEYEKQIRADTIQDIRVEIANRVPSRPITKRAIEVWEDKYWLLINLDKKLEQMQKGEENE